MFAPLLQRLAASGRRTAHALRRRILAATKPADAPPLIARVACTTGIELVRTAFRAPRENALCERFLGSVRRECLDHLLVLGETHLRRILTEYTAYFTRDRPHQGLRQRIRAGQGRCAPPQSWAACTTPTVERLEERRICFSARTGPNRSPPYAST